MALFCLALFSLEPGYLQKSQSACLLKALTSTETWPFPDLVKLAGINLAPVLQRNVFQDGHAVVTSVLNGSLLNFWLGLQMYWCKTDFRVGVGASSTKTAYFYRAPFPQ